MLEIANKTLWDLSFYIFAIEYFEENTLHFMDVTDVELIAKSIVDNHD